MIDYNKIYTENKDTYTKLNYGDVEITVKKRLTIKERADFVNDILNTVIRADEKGNVYIAPYLRKFAYGYYILTYFTDIDMPVDAAEANMLIDGTDIVNRVVAASADGYIQELIGCANEAIEFRKTEITKETNINKILGILCDIIKNVKEKTAGMTQEDFVGQLVDAFPKLGAEIEAFFAGTK